MTRRPHLQQVDAETTAVVARLVAAERRLQTANTLLLTALADVQNEDTARAIQRHLRTV